MARRRILFDLDGTLTDSSEGIVRSLQDAIERMGRPAPPYDELTWVIGPDIRLSLGRLLDTDDRDDIERALGLYRERYGRVGLLENRVYDGVLPMLGELRESGATLVVATAKPLVYAERVIAHFGLDRYFERVFGPALDGTLGAKPDLLAHILAECGFDASESAMVGDRLQDVEGARAVGIPCVGVRYGYGDDVELRDADAHCDAPPEIPAALRALE